MPPFVEVLGSFATGVNDAWGNSSVQNAIQVLEQLSDLGRALPFVAPAFVLLSLIIQVEKKARDADLKCTDLLNRVTFLVEQLEVLRRVDVTDSTRRVIERMNDAIKDAAALIQAYRKQSVIARRLNMGNRDKFLTCAQAISACANDLMMSLQIQQTGQLDILARSIPVDSEDEAAESFVNRLGGAEKIKADPSLIVQFAEQLHLKVDDDTIRQINTSISDLMGETQNRLQHMLEENAGIIAFHSIKELVAQMNEAEKEQQFTCVQCGTRYRNSTNGANSCTFHPASYPSRDGNYPCCSSRIHCQSRSHRAKHHCDYPYGPFFKYSSNIINYIDTVDKWVAVEDRSMSGKDNQKAFIGQLLRLASRGDFLQEPTIIISVGTVWHTSKYFLDTFTCEDLRQVNDFVRMSGNTTIFRTSSDESDYSMAEWVIGPTGNIVGIRLSVKADTSTGPSTKLCPIDLTHCSKSGEVVVESEGGLRSFKPRSPYILPETVRLGRELREEPLRATRTDFKTRTSHSLPLMLRVMSDPPLKANPEFARLDADIFTGSISIFNKSPAASPNPMTIASASAYYRLVGEKEYALAAELHFTGDQQLPATIDSRRSCVLDFKVVVPRSNEDAQLQIRWFNRAFVARKRPIRIKLVFRDMEEEECSLVVEHVFDPLWPLDRKKDEDLAFFHIDDSERMERRAVHVKGPEGNRVISFNGHNFDVLHLQKSVFHAMKSGESEVDLSIGGDQSGLWQWRVWALIDLSCLRVYAFKVLVRQGERSNNPAAVCLGYVLCPEYGEVRDETRPIRYATEKVEVPELHESIPEAILTDDSFDDDAPDEPQPSGARGSTGSGHMPIVLPDELNIRLKSIDNNLSRIATALELLVGHLSKTAP
ncbi:hypothetical protein GLOTRDRAFT_115201 [Gloeophyllum trabeum ATCC 11539]|uniref:Mixed lineage kinase domain-containing protein n=1 Tax=Gloeophyllum trabeum (strain ATCC 11539 / FP-39264 / Madison 617) TaxID=670483 RepID=S7RVA4_GLOTA|nr:uncharacterized protein GLOTRDRAFT_115201 [Gloeophyllum trabeum ATCC 11539]EPQ57164.1 hypothetical protein GLOTRDRAFT_115201 [Gloeophyllum trabeum ATCC 11539]